MLAVFRPLVSALCCPFYCCWCHFLHHGGVNAARFSAVGCRRYAALFTAVGGAFYTTAIVNAARFSAVVCRRQAGYFTADGAVFYTTAMVNAS